MIANKNKGFGAVLHARKVAAEKQPKSWSKKK